MICFPVRTDPFVRVNCESAPDYSENIKEQGA